MIHNIIFSKLSNNQKKLTSNILWSTLGKIINMSGSLLIGILIAREFGPDEYGLMNYVISFVTIFSIISNFGLNNIEIREFSKNPSDKNSIFGTCFFIRSFFSVIAFIIVIITTLSIEREHKTIILIIIYAIYLFSSPFEIIKNYYTSIIDIKKITISEISRMLFGLISKALLLVVTDNIVYFIIAFTVDFFINSYGYIIIYKRNLEKISDWKIEKSKISYYLKESFPLVLSGAAVVIYSKIDQVLIHKMIDNESVGYFATAEKFLSLILFLPIIMTQTIAPVLVKMKAVNNFKYNALKLQFVSIILWISILLALIISAMSEPLIYYTYGDKYLNAVPVLKILSWKTVGMSLSITSGQLMIIEGIQKWVILRNLIGCFIAVILNILIIPIYGIIGSAYVTIITVISSGYLIHLFIPIYKDIFFLQTKSIFLGWKFIFNKKLLS